ncbi:uncharacterized protein [Primulina huaijiensis]|uniref:uncharacterized protein isoform X2 n=1 Tax=Primulina huaijiensis TaxID=1492673 RepID=UPI003CC735E2
MDELMKNTFAVHVVAASASVALGTTIIYPLDSLTVLKQVGSTTRKQLAVGQVLARVRAISGYSGLYGGLGWLIVGRTFGLGARFGVYEILTAFYKDGREYSYVDVSEALMAGFAAGMVESLVSSPFEIIKLRAQVASASRLLHSSSIAEKSSVSPLISSLLPRYSMNMMSMSNSICILSTLTTKHENLVSALREYPWMMTGSGRPPAVSNVRKPSDIIALEGWRGLWRGLRSGVFRDSIFGGIFFSSWQFLHNAMINWKAVGMDPIPRLCCSGVMKTWVPCLHWLLALRLEFLVQLLVLLLIVSTPLKVDHNVLLFPSIYPWRGNYLNGANQEQDSRG